MSIENYNILMELNKLSKKEEQIKRSKKQEDNNKKKKKVEKGREWLKRGQRSGVNANRREKSK